MITKSNLDVASIEKFNALQQKGVHGETRLEFYKNLMNTLGECEGLFVTQKNTADETDIVILTQDNNFTLVMGNSEFFTTNNLDQCIMLGFGLITVFGLQYPDYCQRLAAFLGSMSEAKFNIKMDTMVRKKLDYFFKIE